ncbi:hypothetical protein M378DRAFT_74929 [Amanita muscaria Koide BX008]|uniref:Uncharacterized protein n=1 Tax=Amanita muscaria (strain Koide BX008) TaxID=946122 RepID=A0A0C2STJ0_AMAMK|nr:hypothetical protein M378DRAFT_74929 [Amanita muscaria Koide BX008]
MRCNRVVADALYRIFMEKVLTGETKIRDKDFPSFLYDETIPYDPHNKDEGLLQGHVLIRAYRHIITGPKTALKPDLIKAKNSRCKSEKIVLTKSDRYTIAYTVSQGSHNSSCANDHQ